MTVDTTRPPAPDTGPPPDLYPPLEYHQVHRAGERGWWRPLVGLLLMGLAMVVVGPLLWLVPFLVYFAASGASVLDSLGDLVSLDDLTPAGLAYLNLALASLIPAAWFVTRVVHGLKPRWLTSVLPRMRWRYFAACFGLAVLALLAMLVVAAVVPSAAGTEMSGGVNEITGEARAFLLVVLLLTPFQAAGEEYGFRGYLTQAIGGIVGGAVGRLVAVVVPALLFALAHGAQSIPVFFDRFAFGIVAGILVIATGGLEAAIAMHVLNNWLAFGLAVLFGDLSSAMSPGEGSWWSVPVTLTQSLVYLALALWVARRMGLSRHSDPAVLIASRGRVYGSAPVPSASA